MDDPQSYGRSDFAVRYGFTENVDVGAKLTPLPRGFGTGPVTWAADVNFALITNDNFALSVDPYLSTLSVDSSLVYGYASGNLLVDVFKSKKATVTAGVKPGYVFVTGSEGGWISFSLHRRDY